jgi:DNA (cytosine-5)-methyltransferase 1
LSHDSGNTFEVMCKALNEIGYAVDFQVLNSKHYNVPQNRERIFIVANRDAQHEDWVIDGNDVVSKAKARIQKLRVRTFNFSFPNSKSVNKRLRDVLQDQVLDKYYLSKEKTEKLILESRVLKEPQVSVVGSLEYYNFDMMNRVHDIDGLSPTIQTLQGGSREPKIAVETRKLNRNELGEETDLSHTLMARDYKGLMNYDMTGVVEIPNWFPKPDDVMRTLRIGGKSSMTAKHNCDHITDGYRIRKLTPLECFRLQGFTDEQFYKLKEASISDSQLYKQAGNAVTVNVIDALGKALLAYDIQNHQHDC